jgi:hypothetical protein
MPALFGPAMFLVGLVLMAIAGYKLFRLLTHSIWGGWLLGVPLGIIAWLGISATVIMLFGWLFWGTPSPIHPPLGTVVQAVVPAPGQPQSPSGGGAPTQSAPSSQGGLSWAVTPEGSYAPIGSGCYTVGKGEKLNRPGVTYYMGDAVWISDGAATLWKNSGPVSPPAGHQPFNNCPSGAAAPASAPAAAAAPAQAAPAQPASGGVDPAADLGGSWTKVSDKEYSLNGKADIHGNPKWTVHTPAHKVDPGLAPGDHETTSSATAYLDPYGHK